MSQTSTGNIPSETQRGLGSISWQTNGKTYRVLKGCICN